VLETGAAAVEPTAGAAGRGVAPELALVLGLAVAPTGFEADLPVPAAAEVDGVLVDTTTAEDEAPAGEWSRRHSGTASARATMA